MGKILHTSKIFEVDDDQLIKTLSKVYIMIGLRPEHLPTKEIDAYNIGFIRRNFGTRPLKEITIAFELAVLGQLEVDAKCYDQFTMEYFCRIMNAYRVYFNRNPPISDFKADRTPLIENTIEPLEKEKEVAEWLKSTLNSIEFLPEYVYGYFDELGYVKLTKEEKISYMTKAAKKHLQKLAQDLSLIKEKNRWESILYNGKGVLDFTGSNMTLIKNTAKKMIIFDIIKKHQNDNSEK